MSLLCEDVLRGGGTSPAAGVDLKTNGHAKREQETHWTHHGNSTGPQQSEGECGEAAGGELDLQGRHFIGQVKTLGQLQPAAHTTERLNISVDCYSPPPLEPHTYTPSLPLTTNPIENTDKAFTLGGALPTATNSSCTHPNPSWVGAQLHHGRVRIGVVITTVLERCLPHSKVHGKGNTRVMTSTHGGPGKQIQ